MKNAIWLAKKKKEDWRNRSRCLGDLKKFQRVNSSLISELHFEIQKVKIYIKIKLIGLLLNFRLSLIWDFRISGRLFVFCKYCIFSLYCFGFVCKCVQETLYVHVILSLFLVNDEDKMTSSANSISPNVPHIFSVTMFLFFFSLDFIESRVRDVCDIFLQELGWGKYSSLKISLFESSNKSLEDVKKLRLFELVMYLMVQYYGNPI